MNPPESHMNQKQWDVQVKQEFREEKRFCVLKDGLEYGQVGMRKWKGWLPEVPRHRVAKAMAPRRENIMQ